MKGNLERRLADLEKATQIDRGLLSFSEGTPGVYTGKAGQEYAKADLDALNAAGYTCIVISWVTDWQKDGWRHVTWEEPEHER